MELIPFSPADRSEFLTMSRAMYDSPAVAHAVSDSVFLGTFDACLAGNKNIEGLLLREGSATIGYLLLAHTFSTEIGAPIIMGEELYLYPEYRGQGRGRQILELLREKYHGNAGAIKLECTPENVGAMHLYRSVGFEPLPYTAMVWSI